MSSIVDTRRRLNSARTLQGVVTTMKTLSAVRITQYRRSVAALRQSTRTLELAVQALLQLRPELLTGAQASTGSSVTLVALGTDRGLCGPFNERITGHATGLLRARLPAGQEPTILAVGRRLETRLTAVGHEPNAQVSPPGSVSTIDAAVVRVLSHLDQWLEQGRADQLYLAYNRPLRGASYEPVTVRILPVDATWLQRVRQRDWPSNRLPMILGDTEELLRGVVRQFTAHSLVQAFAASQASENAARLAAMDAAERNIEERLGELQTAWRQARQNAVTSELLDVQAAFAALNSDS